MQIIIWFFISFGMQSKSLTSQWSISIRNKWSAIIGCPKSYWLMSLCQAGYPEGTAGERPGHLAGDGVSRPPRGPHVRPRVLHRAPDEPLPPPRRQVPVCPHRQQRVGDPCQAPCARFKTGDFITFHFPEIISIVLKLSDKSVCEWSFVQPSWK